MDVASRFQPRVRAQSYLDREREAMPDDGDSEPMTRRKFQRTATDSDATSTFRKPALPASATRPAGLEHRPSLSQRRRSTLRENVRVPSGPREFPSPGNRVGSISTTVPAISDTPNSAQRSFLPQTTSEPMFRNAAAHTGNSRFSFGNNNQHYSTDDTDSPTTPAERAPEGFDFVPTMNFDDFQNSIVDPNWTSPLLSEFPSVSGGRALPKEDETEIMARHNGYASGRPGLAKQNSDEKSSLGRAASFRKRLSTAPSSRQAPGQTAQPQTQTSASQPNLSVRTKRQSTMPSATAPPTQTGVGTGNRTPRKSVGPGLLNAMMENRKGSSQQVPTMSVDTSLKPALARTSSLSKARRTTIQPGAPAIGAASTLTATTQSRANKVKSLQPPPRGDPDTPNGRPVSKGNQNRSQTPSSSGNKRQSTMSGRASGLGARTISPTDARRLKRMSMMAPPMPTNNIKGPPTPQDEQPNPFTRPELPRLAQPSPSLIPRKMSTSTPTSARASPEARYGFYGGGGVSLSTKSSYQSLLSNPNNSTSRLPTPKPRNVHSSSAQYGEDEELVPPVPAIPKAYESPKEHEQPFFSSSLKSSYSAFSNMEPGMVDLDLAGTLLPSPSVPSGETPRASIDVPSSDTTRKRSGEQGRHHKRTATIGNATGAATVGPKSSRAQPDANGRKNNNLQPLRLPPLNLMPINTPTSSRIANGFPRPSQELESRDDFMSVQTPEPKRTAKTPSTPMTASKATFFRRQDEAHQKALRSSSSHYALRDTMQIDSDSGNTTRFFDDSDTEPSSGVPIPSSKLRSAAITPFSSGSLPKASGEFVRLRARPSGEYNDDYDLGQYAESLQFNNAKPQGPRPKTSGTVVSQTSKAATTPSSIESQVMDQTPQVPEPRKESSTSGLRRKLSLGWRRSSSKAATHADNKSSPQQQASESEGKEKLDKTKLQKRSSEMPPPKLPASATWSGEVPNLPSSARPSLETARRKSTLPLHANGDNDQQSMTNGGAVKTRALHSEQPQPVAATRASSWGNFGASRNGTEQGPIGKPSVVPAKHKLTASTISANVKDKDDLAADDEMRRLSQKRKDVDTAARESEALKARAVARSPVTPERVLHDRNSTLNIYERGEIMDFERDGIYFTGGRNAKKIIGSLSPSPTTSASEEKGKAGNYGYDDERGDYNIVFGDHLAYRYEVIDLLGKGSFGQVVRCVDHKDGGVVAVKIIRNKKRFHQQALVEVGILGKLREWDPDGSNATLSITSSFYFRNHLCIVTPCLSINLYEFIRAHNFTGFSLPLIRRFSRQLLACLVLLQTKRIIHCDLKPENILLCDARKADVRVIDFGSSCREEEKVYTYIQSRFYRSPEVILGSSYGLGIDMWSLGCILAELWTGYPLFPGENEQEQLACIMEIFGPPDRHLVERCTRKKLFFDSVGKPRVTVSSKGRRRRPSSKTLAQALKTEDEAFVDFVARCLRWDPERRMKPAEAVGHPFITGLPFQKRPGIPDEARRAARVRSSAAVPTTSTVNGGPVAAGSPIKRTVSTKDGNAFAQQQQATPGKASRALPETPQTAVRTNAAPVSGLNLQASPSRPPLGANRRHSTVATAGGAAAVAGSKRASNGAVLGGGMMGQQKVGTGAPIAAAPAGNMAQMAARESMGAGASSAGRWRT